MACAATSPGLTRAASSGGLASPSGRAQVHSPVASSTATCCAFAWGHGRGSRALSRRHTISAAPQPASTGISACGSPGWGSSAVARSRSHGFLLRACNAATERCESWDEEDSREAVEGGAVDGPEHQLPPFQWDLPPFPSIPPPQKQEPWGFEKAKKHRRTGSGGAGRAVQGWMEGMIPPGLDVFQNLSALNYMNEVFVILFGVGDGADEGIYSLKSTNSHGIGIDTVIAFESKVDAERYAALLEAVMVWTPSVFSISPGELLVFVNESDLHCRLQPEGSHIFPPDWNIPVGLTDWERTMRLRKGHYSVLEADPDTTATPHIVEAEAGLTLPQLSDIGDIEDIRRRLEDLYFNS